MLLSLARNQGTTLPCPFRFQPMWLSHSSFPAVVRDARMSLTALSQAISNFETKVKEWNKNVFGNLFYQKKRVIARLKGVQLALSRNANDFLVGLKKDLRAKLNEVSKLEENFWTMKVRITWLVEGDRNTGFFHTSALVWRRRNHISCIKD